MLHAVDQKLRTTLKWRGDERGVAFLGDVVILRDG
jgi:hypothetical protein